MRRIAWLLAGLLTLAAWLPAARAQPRGDVTELRLEYTPAAVLLSAAWRMELAPVVESALYQGIAMHFVAEAQVVRPRWYWSDKTVAQATRHLRLSYQPLTRRWRLTQTSGRDEAAGQPGLALGQSFDALDDALAALQRLAGWKIADASAVEEGVTYQVQFQFRLDISQMPRPLQFGAVGRSGWNLALSRRMDWTPMQELP
ncbi:hypothetical protein GCM10027019_31800 [Melaminivora jejuensis]|uniref:DUF4390 domain-containing protein n=1 Tax=Melaminivora jejuensis TaxID=1267217 RepID=UPI001E4BADC2|nr:DUF4390 domain-containing protein [Melaminivora jejuensis]UHJ64694.1 DUF4390 domain-containing protein [Melaminivora jejuensis]